MNQGWPKKDFLDKSQQMVSDVTNNRSQCSNSSASSLLLNNRVEPVIIRFASKRKGYDEKDNQAEDGLQKSIGLIN